MNALPETTDAERVAKYTRICETRCFKTWLVAAVALNLGDRNSSTHNRFVCLFGLLLRSFARSLCVVLFACAAVRAEAERGLQAMDAVCTRTAGTFITAACLPSLALCAMHRCS